MSTTKQPSEDPNHVVNTEFWNEIMHDVYGPRKGGAIIFVDAENARKGVAKTSGAVALARLFAQAFGYDLQHEDLTLSGAEYLKRYQEQPGHDQPSVLVLDEFVGAGAGDKRRSMSNENLDFGRAWQLLRTKRVITLATLPDWNEADKRLKKLADYRVWMRERPIGSFQGYKITVPFNSVGGSIIKLKGLGDGDTRRILFPNMDAENDTYYKHLSEKKDNLIHSDTWNANELDTEDELEPDEIKKRDAIKFAIRLYEPWDEDTEKTYREVAKVIDEFSHAWVGDRVREWRNGEHRDLVPDPTEG